MRKDKQNRQLTKKADKTEERKRMFLEAFIKNCGNITEACKKANICRATFYLWLAKDPIFEQKFEDAKESLIDWAESQLYKAIREGNLTAIIFYLKTKAKHRGYVERVEATGAEGEPLEVTFRIKEEIVNSNEVEKDVSYDSRDCN